MDELGSFQVTVSSKGVDTKEEVPAALVKKVNLRFTPSTVLKENLQKAQFRPK